MARPKRQNTSIPDTLPPEQQQAIELLLSGKSDREVGEACGVSRQTVNEWKNQNSGFKRAMQSARRELWLEHVDKLRGLVSQALDVIGEDLGNTQDPRLRQAAAIHVLKSCGLYGASLEPETVGEMETAELFNFNFG